MWSATGPFADLYLVAFEPPQTGKYRERSFKATEKISARLVADPFVARYIRRIAYMEAVVNGGDAAFKKRFAFGAGV